MDINIDLLKKNHQKIHYFGLGFIQVKIDSITRVHFYSSELPAIISDEEIHNHRYDFTSVIIKGGFGQQIYQVIPGDTHLLEEESCQEGVSGGKTKLCSVKMIGEHVYYPNSRYFVDHNVFHKVQAVDCVTLLTRSDYKKDLAEVIRPVGAEKICPFSQKIEEGSLWEIVDSMLK